jgi:diguanylate cyclase (GGDEF)-like protein/PAS domain S-box-containing protein
MECLDSTELVLDKGSGETDLFTRFAEENKDPILSIDKKGILLYLNQSAKSLLSEWNPRIGNILPEELLASLQQCIGNTACRKLGIEITVKERHLIFQPIVFEDSNLLLLHGHYVSWWRSYEEHLKLLANVFENVDESIIVTDDYGTIKAVNPAFTIINGFRADEAIGATPRILKSNRHPAEFYKWMWNDLLKKGRWKGKIWNRRKNGEVYPALLSISAIRDGSGKITHFCSICNDIKGRKYETDELRFETCIDSLTGLPSMQLFYDRLDRTLIRARNNHSMIGILTLNLDGFKKVNQNYGYNMGDLLLQKVARRLKRFCRDHDTLTRSSGDEYIIAASFEDNRMETVSELADRIIKSFSVPINLNENIVQLTIRIGISLYPRNAEDAYTLLEQSQEAVSQARNKGGNKCVIYPL